MPRRKNIEDSICCSINDVLTIISAGHKALIPYIHMHIPNEGRRSVVQNGILKCMGMIPGAADYIIMMQSKCLAIEIKKPCKNPYKLLTDRQLAFAKRCKDVGIPYYLATSLDQVVQILLDEGIIHQKCGSFIRDKKEAGNFMIIP